jgi:hypothetical protein
MSELDMAYKVAVAKRTGPIWSVVNVLEGVGWQLTAYNEFKCSDVLTLRLDEVSPAFVKTEYLARLQDIQYSGWWTDWSSRHSVTVGKPDVVVLRQMMADDKLSRLRKITTLKVHAGVVPTRVRLAGWGAKLEQECTECGKLDTWEHRLWECSRSAEVRKKLQGVFGEYMKAAPELERVYGHFRSPAGKGPPAGLDYVVYRDGGPCDDETYEWAEGDAIYVDGSCFNSRVPGHQVAAAAAVQVDDNGMLKLGVYAVLPGTVPLTSMAGEHVSLVLVKLGLRAGQSACIVSDCATVVKDGTYMVPGLEYKRVYAGIWRELEGHDLHFIKMKAHLSREQAVKDGLGHLWHGNYRVDLLAKKAALEWSSNEALIREVEAARKLVRTYYTYAQDVAALWKQEVTASDVQWARRKSVQKQRREHTWEWNPISRRFRCTLCLVTVASKHGRARAKWCMGRPRGAAGTLAYFASMGHLLRQIRGDRGVVLYTFCAWCGCYASGKGVNLNKQCRKEASGQRARLKKLLEGKHPTNGVRIGEVVVLDPTLYLDEVAAGDADCFEQARYEDIAPSEQADPGRLPTLCRLERQLGQLEELEREEAAARLHGFTAWYDEECSDPWDDASGGSTARLEGGAWSSHSTLMSG